jgi:capsular polysaccharide export protein
VVDQDYGDTSILLGGASDDVFDEMLEAALDENPGHDVVVKTHPDSLVNGGRRGHFSDLADSDRVFVMRSPANPYSVMENVSRVYVATSTFGFEALMAGKPVHVFGMPWYAGWGATNDRKKIHRRSKARSVVELFLAFYVRYTRYADPTTHCPCSVMDAINTLLSLRSGYADICGK